MTNRTTRRGFVCGLAAAAAARGAGRPVLVYVGSYSSPQGPEGSRGNGKGIYLFEMNPGTGKLSQKEIFANGNNPSWLAFSPDRSHLYSANETESGSASAYAIDRNSGKLKLLNTVSSEGAGPAHLSVHPSGKYAFVANYAGGTIAVLPIKPNGELGAASDVKHDKGTPGPANAKSAPPGSFAISGHDKPHAHMIEADPSGKYVLAADLGLDRIFVYRFDAANGKLTPNDPPAVELPPGDGPRHFAFHRNGRWFYSLQEEASTLATYDFEPGTGRLKLKQTISTLPKGFAGTDFTSEVMLSPDAKFVYAANRLHDSIAWFRIGSDGTLTLEGEAWTRGDYPRSFNIDPSGGFLYSCNQRADAIATFRVNRNTGELMFTGDYTPVGTPAMILFLT